MASRDGGGGCLTTVAVVASILVFVGGAVLLFLIATDSPVFRPEQTPTKEHPEEELGPKSFEDYSWEELSEISDLIAAAGSDEEGREVAALWGVGVGDTRALTLTDGRKVSATVVGLRADTLADGSGKAGITLMISPIALRPMNSSMTCEGGWEASELRSWLSAEARSLLPAELLDSAKAVLKTTNNVGGLDDATKVTQTTDVLWAFSLSEVCGPITLFVDEYGEEVWWRTYYIDYSLYDAVLSAEGAQYEYFQNRDITCNTDSEGTLSLAYDGAAVAWWYRSAYPTSGYYGEGSYFYQAMSTGYPCTIAEPASEAGVVVGVCL